MNRKSIDGPVPAITNYKRSVLALASENKRANKKSLRGNERVTCAFII